MAEPRFALRTISPFRAGWCCTMAGSRFRRPGGIVCSIFPRWIGGAARPARRPAGLSRPAIAGARRRRMARRLCAAHALGTVACLWARGADWIAISSRRNRSTVTPTEGARGCRQLPGDPRRAHRGVQGRQCPWSLPDLAKRASLRKRSNMPGPPATALSEMDGMTENRNRVAVTGAGSGIGAATANC